MAGPTALSWVVGAGPTPLTASTSPAATPFQAVIRSIVATPHAGVDQSPRAAKCPTGREPLVHVDGYFAGEADDFGRLFRRLYLPPGSHVIDFALDGHETFRLAVFFTLDDSRKIRHTMRLLRAGEAAMPPMVPRATVTAQTAPPPPAPGGRRLTPFGVLTLHVDPLDAVIEIEGQEWTSPGPNHELVIHLTPGRHDVHVSKAGYRPFSTAIELSEGAATKLTVQLRC